MNRMMCLNLLGVLGLLVGVPYGLHRGVDRFPLLRSLRDGYGPSVSLSMVRGEESAPRVTVSDVLPAARTTRVVIEPLPVPPVTVTLANVNTDETATFQIGRAGELRPEEAAQVKTFFRCRRTGKEKTMAPGVLALLAEVALRWPGRTIEVVSGFRAPPYGAPHSKHFAGHAIDLRVRGVRGALVRDFIWRDHHGVGVGHYPSENFVHLDARPGEEDMAWTGEGEDGANTYAPRWARKARHQAPSRRLAAAGPTQSHRQSL
jgi:uncharacterized protein YcbK (DUF882 family)